MSKDQKKKTRRNGIKEKRKAEMAGITGDRKEE